MRVTAHIEGLDQAVKDFDVIADRAARLGPALDRLGLHHQRKAQRILRSGERGIQTRHGASGLGASITFHRPAENELDVGSNKVYAASQQFGPRGGFYESSRPGGFLAIPIADNLQARGNARYDSPRQVSDGFFFTSQAGRLLFGRRKAKAKSKRRRKSKQSAQSAIELLFVLVKRVVGIAHKYVTHDEPDNDVWDGYAANWILRGKH